MHREAGSQPNKRPKKNGGRGSVASRKNSRQVGCVCQDIDPVEVQFDFPEGHRILGTKAQRAILRRCITPHENSGKKGSIARCDSAH